MFFRGMLEGEGGLKLFIDIDIPDGQKEVYVTNVSAQCLVIPRDRWPLDLLDLADSDLGALTSAGLKTVGDVVNEAWEVRLPEVLRQYSGLVQQAVDRLRSVALTFDPPETEQQSRMPFPIPAEPQRRTPPTVPQEARAEAPAVAQQRQRIPLEANLTTIGVPGKIAKILSGRHAATIGQLLERGRSKLVMTPGLNSADVELIESKLRMHGFSWPAREASA